MLGGMYKPLLVVSSILLLLSISLVNAECSGSSPITQRAPTETWLPEFSCSAGNERNQPCNVSIYNVTQGGEELITTISCTTPSVLNEVFTVSYIVPTGFNTTNNLSANLSGTNLEGSTTVEVVSAGANACVISGISQRGNFLGRSSSVEAIVQDENGENLNNGLCTLRITDPTTSEHFDIMHQSIADGDIDEEFILSYVGLSEGKDYVIELTCSCGSAGSVNECWGSSGTNASELEYSTCSSNIPLKTASWITWLEDPFPLVYVNGTRYPNASFIAGFHYATWLRNATNHNPEGEALSSNVRTLLVSNDTGKGFGELNEQSTTVGERTFTNGTLASQFNHRISPDALTGSYFIRLFFDVFFKGIQVAQLIVETEVFTVTSLKDTIVVNEVTLKDYFGNEITTNSSTQSLTTMPSSNSTNPHYSLTEKFGFQACINFTSNHTEESLMHIGSLILENPTTSESHILIDHNTPADSVTIELEPSTTGEICIPLTMSDDISTHSDYRLSFLAHVGDKQTLFRCPIDCEYTGHSDYFYVADIGDMIDVNTFITKPNSTFKGRPGIFIVNDKNQKLYMFDDYNFTDQTNTDWDNASATCNNKNNASDTRLCDLSVYGRAGQSIRACLELVNNIGNEVLVLFEQINIDRDTDKSFKIMLREPFQHAVKSRTDRRLYLNLSPSRSRQGDGNIVDGYDFLCTEPFIIPPDTVGGNDWDIQMRGRISQGVYGNEKDILWNIESDEFPIYGLIPSQPTWKLHLTDPPHYQVPEKWVKVSDTVYVFNMSIPSFGADANTFDFGEHVLRRTMDQDTPYERIENITITYQNGSSIPYTTEEFMQNDEIVLVIKSVDLSRADNNFTITANLYDLTKRSTEALEGIENKTGTFLFTVDAASSNLAGEPMLFTLSAMIESTEASREVEFECFIPVAGVERNTITWTKMLFPGVLYTDSRYINVPDGLTGTQLLRCDLNQFSLGGQSVSAQDPFDIIPLSALGSIPSGNVIDVDAPLNISMSIVNVDRTHSVIVLYSPNEQTYVVRVSWILQGNTTDYPIGDSRELLFPFMDDGTWIGVQEIPLTHPMGLEKIFASITINDILIGTWSVDIKEEAIGEEDKNPIEEFLDKYFGDDDPNSFFGMSIPGWDKVKEELGKINNITEASPSTSWPGFFLLVGVMGIGYLVYDALSSYYEKYDRDEE